MIQRNPLKIYIIGNKTYLHWNSLINMVFFGQQFKVLSFLSFLLSVNFFFFFAGRYCGIVGKNANKRLTQVYGNFGEEQKTIQDMRWLVPVVVVVVFVFVFVCETLFVKGCPSKFVCPRFFLYLSSYCRFLSLSPLLLLLLLFLFNGKIWRCNPGCLARSKFVSSSVAVVRHREGFLSLSLLLLLLLYLFLYIVVIVVRRKFVSFPASLHLVVPFPLRLLLLLGQAKRNVEQAKKHKSYFWFSQFFVVVVVVVVWQGAGQAEYGTDQKAPELFSVSYRERNAASFSCFP